MLKEDKRVSLQEVIDTIRKSCIACNGTGFDGAIYREEITMDMAIDAGDRNLAGQVYHIDRRSECEYCGRPISAVINHFNESST